MLQFPNTKAILWDHTPIASPAQLHLAYYRNPRLRVSDKVLRLVLRHLDNCRESSYSCILVGSFTIDEDGQGLSLVLDRFDRGHNSVENGLCPTTQTPGDVLVPFQALKSKARAKNLRENYASALKCLLHRCGSKDAIDLGSFLITRGSCSSRVVHDVVSCDVEFDVVCPNNHFLVTQINPVPIVPTALSKNLAGPMSLHHLQGEPKTGYLTMDHTRKLLLVLESDPKAYGLPLVGIWIIGVPFIYSPYVWACCQRYIFNQSIQDRVCQPPEPFLLLLYSPLHSKPEFYECTTRSGKIDLDYSLYSACESVQLPKFGYNGEVKFSELDTSLVVDGPKLDPFTAAQELVKQHIPNKSDKEVKTGENAFVLSMEDITPRVMPSPHPSQMPVIDTMVPEVSLMFHDSDRSGVGVAQSGYKPGWSGTVSSTACGQAARAAQPAGPPYSQAPSEGQTRPAMVRHGSMPNLNRPSQSQEHAGPEQMYSHRFMIPQQRGTLTCGHPNNGQPRPALHPGQSRKLPLPPRPAHVPQMYNPRAYAPAAHPQQGPSGNTVNDGYSRDVPTAPSHHYNQYSANPANSAHPQTRQPLLKQPLVQSRPRSARPYASEYQTRVPQAPSYYSQGQANFPHPQAQAYRPVTQPQPPQPSPHLYRQSIYNSYPQQPGYAPHPAPPSSQHLSTRPAKAVHFQPAQPAPTCPGYIESYGVVELMHQQYSQRMAVPTYIAQEQSTPSVQLNSGSVHPGSSVPNQVAAPLPQTLHSQQVPLSTKPAMPSSSGENTGVENHVPEPIVEPSVRTGYQANLTDNSCRSSQDSGLSVTPDRPTSKGDSVPTSPKCAVGNPTAVSLSSLTNSPNFNNVPPEVYQLLLQQDSQLKQMQAQIQELLKVQSPKSSATLSKSTSQSCSVAINTSLWESRDSETALTGHESTSAQTSPVKTPGIIRALSPVKQISDTPPAKSGATTPADVRHRGPPQLNSTAKFDSGDILTSGDLTTMMNNVGLERTDDSIQSEMIVDLPSFHSSPTQSRESRADLSESPISASMVEEQGETGDEGPVEERSEQEQQEYYNQLMVNIQKLLQHHSGEEGDEDVWEEDRSEEDQHTLQDSQEDTGHHTTLTNTTTTPSKLAGLTQDEDHINSLLRFGTSMAALDTTFIPKINYVSMFLDSDTDTSMEINAMAMKYLKDDQLTQMAKLRAAACVNGKKNGKKAALLQQVLQAGGKATPNVTQYGMSPNDMTFATKKYMQKYGLLNSSKCEPGQTTPVSVPSNVPRSARSSDKRPKSAQVVRTESSGVPRSSPACQTAPDGHHSELYESYINVISCSVRRNTPVDHNGQTVDSPDKLLEYRMRESLVQRTLQSPSKRTVTCKQVPAQVRESPRAHAGGTHKKQNSASRELDSELAGKSQLEIDTILDVSRLKQLPKLL